VLLEARRNGFLYRSRRAELHREGHAPDYPATVATPWRLACDQLCAPEWALLNLLAWYAPDTIPLDQLLTPDTDHLTLPDPVNAASQPRLTDPLHQHRAILELVAYGLLTHAGGAAGSVVGYPLRHARRIRSP
jgi:hypothetical protein